MAKAGWSSVTISNEVKEIASANANRERMSVGAWISRAIENEAKGRGNAPASGSGLSPDLEQKLRAFLECDPASELGAVRALVGLEENSDTIVEALQLLARGIDAMNNKGGAE